MLFPLNETVWSRRPVISTFQFSTQPYIWQHNLQQIKPSQVIFLGSEADFQSPCLPNLCKIMHIEKIRLETGFHCEKMRLETGFHWMLCVFLAPFFSCGSIHLNIRVALLKDCCYREMFQKFIILLFQITAQQ